MFTLAAADVASAATYAGRAVDDPKTRVEFQKTGGEIRGFEVHDVRLRCLNGDSFRDGTVFGAMRITQDDKFQGSFTNEDEGQTGRAGGSLLGAGRARGWLRITASFDNTHCTTDIVKWRARRI